MMLGGKNPKESETLQSSACRCDQNLNCCRLQYTVSLFNISLFGQLQWDEQACPGCRCDQNINFSMANCKTSSCIYDEYSCYKECIQVHFMFRSKRCKCEDDMHRYQLTKRSQSSVHGGADMAVLALGNLPSDSTKGVSTERSDMQANWPWPRSHLDLAGSMRWAYWQNLDMTTVSIWQM